MYLSFNALIIGLLALYCVWMGISEHRKEQASDAALSPDQRSRFAKEYSFGRENAEYPENLRAHARITQRARIRKGAAVVILIALPILLLIRGI